MVEPGSAPVEKRKANREHVAYPVGMVHQRAKALLIGNKCLSRRRKITEVVNSQSRPKSPQPANAHHRPVFQHNGANADREPSERVAFVARQPPKDDHTEHRPQPAGNSAR